jgi:small-conductance mechanosensitive channel
VITGPLFAATTPPNAAAPAEGYVRAAWDLVQPVLTLVGASVAAWLIAVVTGWLVRRIHRRSPRAVWVSLQRRCRRPFRAVLVVAAVILFLPPRIGGWQVVPAVHQVLTLALISSVAWLLIQLTGVVEDMLAARVNVDVIDNRQARRVRTQISLLRRALAAVIVFLALVASIMTFPQARTLGASILASAGVLSVVVGLAAQSTLGNLLAGLQIAFSDPIRLDDVVVVEGEWGRVEQITLTYVVVRTWDNRRLILPVSWFTNHTFQNWTRHESRVLGWVLLHVDFSVPLDELRDEMYRVVQESPLWDGKDWVLQVVDTTPTTVVLRGLMSSADSPSNWDLKCEVREKLIIWLREHHPESLPKVHTLIEPYVPGSASGAAGAAAADAAGAIPLLAPPGPPRAERAERAQRDDGSPQRSTSTPPSPPPKPP